MRAYAFGILDPEGERHALAVAHCRSVPPAVPTSPRCAVWPSVLPPLPLLSRLVLAGSAGTTAGAGSGARQVREQVPAASEAARASVGRERGIVAGWSSPGSLTAKLAVMALVVLGAGYAVLGGHAHASPRSPPSRGRVSRRS